MTEPTATEAQSRVEQLLRDAHLQRMRKQWAAAETLVRQALEISPADAMGREMLGDLLAEKGGTEEALACYRTALESQPGKALLEEKVARLVLIQDEERRARDEALLYLGSPKRGAEQKRGVTIAVLLSLLAPGLGQIVMGEYLKGGLMLVVGLGGIAVGGPELIKFFLGMSGMLHRGESADGLLAFLGVVGCIVWLGSLADAAAQAKRARVRGGDV